MTLPNLEVVRLKLAKSIISFAPAIKKNEVAATAITVVPISKDESEYSKN